jgi:hypothetical protein
MIGGFDGMARARKARFYTQLRPLLVGHRAASDRRIFASILPLEDLVATKSATFCNHRTYVSRTMAEGMIGLLAAVHAHFYGDRELATRYRWLASHPRWFTIGADKMSLQYYTQKAFDVASHHIPEEVLARRHAAWPAAMSALCHSRKGGAWTAPF